MKNQYFTKEEISFFSDQNPIFNERQMSFINKKTPKSEIEEKTDKAGNKYKAVKSGYIKALVMLVTGGNFSFEIKEQTFFSSAKEIRTTGKLTIFANGQQFTREQNGKAECNIPDANSFKSSASDCFKKCAAEFGFCWDIYNQEIEKAPQIQEIPYSEKSKIERLKHFLKQCKTPEQIEDVYSKFIETSEETSQLKELVTDHFNRVLNK